MPSAWEKLADVAVGGLTEVGFVPGSSLLLVVSHQGRGVLDLVTGERVARDRQERGSWFDGVRPAALGIGPVDGRWIEVAGLAGGQLPVTTANGWQARRAAQGVALSGPAGQAVAVRESEVGRSGGQLIQRSVCSCQVGAWPGSGVRCPARSPSMITAR